MSQSGSSFSCTNTPSSTRYCQHCKVALASGVDSRSRYCSLWCQRQAQTDRAKAKRRAQYGDIPLVQCKLCGFEGKDLASHITQFHNTPLKEYYSWFQCDAKSIRTESYRGRQSELFAGERNPGFQHGGRLSIFSETNPVFDPDKKLSAIAKSSKSCKTNGNHSSTLTYWLKRGYDLDAAKEKLSDRQRTFSLKKCVEELGEEKGIERWQARQTQWLSNCTHGNFSKASQELFWKVVEMVPATDRTGLFFAQYDPKAKIRDASGTNHESVLKLDGATIRPDFLLESKKVVIEFDGDYWHSEFRVNPERSQKREETLISGGYRVLHIREQDYRADPDGVVNRCIDFIYGDKGLSESDSTMAS